MAETSGQQTAQTIDIGGSDFPPFHFPVVFSDGIASAAHGTGVVKFYLMRINPGVAGTGVTQPSAIAQIVMPMHAFAASVIFLEEYLQRLVKGGEFKQETIDQMKELLHKVSSAASPSPNA